MVEAGETTIERGFVRMQLSVAGRRLIVGFFVFIIFFNKTTEDLEKRASVRGRRYRMDTRDGTAAARRYFSRRFNSIEKILGTVILDSGPRSRRRYDAFYNVVQVRYKKGSSALPKTVAMSQ